MAKKTKDRYVADLLTPVQLVTQLQEAIEYCSATLGEPHTLVLGWRPYCQLAGMVKVPEGVPKPPHPLSMSTVSWELNGMGYDLHLVIDPDSARSQRISCYPASAGLGSVLEGA